MTEFRFFSLLVLLIAKIITIMKQTCQNWHFLRHKKKKSFSRHVNTEAKNKGMSLYFIKRERKMKERGLMKNNEGQNGSEETVLLTRYLGLYHENQTRAIYINTKTRRIWLLGKWGGTFNSFTFLFPLLCNYLFVSLFPLFFIIFLLSKIF